MISVYNILFEKQEEDLSFLKDQVTTVEVNIARVYNYNVKLMQEKKMAEVQGGAPAEK